MWYEIIPFATLFMAGIGVPQYIMTFVHDFVYDTPSQRIMPHALARRMFIRDMNFTDNPRAAGKVGLQNIPDE